MATTTSTLFNLDANISQEERQVPMPLQNPSYASYIGNTHHIPPTEIQFFNGYPNPHLAPSFFPIMLFSFTHGNSIFATSNLGASMMPPAPTMPSTMMEGIIDSNLTPVLSNNTPNSTLCARVQETPEMTIGVIKHCNLQGKMVNGMSKHAELPNSATNRPGPTNPDDLTEALELFTLNS
ncbi:uncharacterized protein ARMOST_16492 [Armillaria ostoyae]|uniref:Uncharacterized protein n=1 Tax=Armillaria ostoyae TaxID=47428 RepID=A0A284RWE1_ARMOS|nr:uncharacterized protein ARMOST_16492 [Armillaria ostoyae]